MKQLTRINWIMYVMNQVHYESSTQVRYESCLVLLVFPGFFINYFCLFHVLLLFIPAAFLSRRSKCCYQSFYLLLPFLKSVTSWRRSDDEAHVPLAVLTGFTGQRLQLFRPNAQAFASVSASANAYPVYKMLQRLSVMMRISYAALFSIWFS